MKQIISKLFSRVAAAVVLATAFSGTVLAQDITDVINNAATSSYLGNTATTTWATDFSITGTSGAVYKIHSMGTKSTSNALQWNSNGFLYMTTAPSGYKLKSVTITTTANKNIGVYAQNSAYSAAPTGTALTTLAATTSGATYTFNSDYSYLALKGTASSTSISSISIVWEKASSAVATVTTIDHSGITNTDVYTSTAAGSLSATVTASGNPVANATVTWSGNNDDVATINASTGAVTLVSAGSVTFTASYAGKTDEYKPSSATYTMTVTSSAPYVQPTEIVIVPNYTFWGKTGLFSGNTYDELSGTKDNVSLEWSRGIGSTYANSSAMRFYKDNELTFTAPSGYEIKSIEIDGALTTDLSFVPDGFDADNQKWSGSSNTVTMSRPSNGASYANISKYTITIGLPSTDPKINANDVSIAFNTTSGSIAYTITNEPSPAGTLTASTESDWLTLGTVGSTVPFTCAENEEMSARTATVTLTYTYGTNEAVTKNVSVTQAASPLIYKTIPALYAAATTTEKSVFVSFNNWVVSGVSSKNVFVTDNEGNGFIIFDSDGGLNTVYSVGDILSGKAVSCNLLKYKEAAEIKSLSATDLSITAGGTATIAEVEMADLAGVNTGALVRYENLTCSVDNNKYYLSDGMTTLQVFNTLYAFGSLNAGKTYNITGVYQQYDSTKEILPRSANDIEEVVVTVPSIVVAQETVNVAATEADGTIDIVYENLPIEDMGDFDIVFYDAAGVTTIDEPDWIEVVVAEQDPNVGEGYVVSYFVEANTGEARSAYFKVLALDGDANEVYSNLVTINQALYVSDTATLPFEFDGGRADIATTPGLTEEGLDTDYGSSPKLKFNTTGDWLILKFNEAPGTLAFDIKGNTFSGGTFKVQTSTDGVNYTDLATYTELGSTQDEEFSNLGDDVRYIKWIYTEKVSGNVALGNITLSRKPVVAPDTVELTLAQGDGGFWGTFYCGSAMYQLPMGAQAFTMNADKKLYRLGDDNTKGMYIPAGVAVVIISADEVITLTKTEYAEEITVNGGANILQGSDYPVAGTGSENVLAKKNGVVGFYNYSGNFIPANKAYYISE